MIYASARFQTLTVYYVMMKPLTLTKVEDSYVLGVVAMRRIDNDLYSISTITDAIQKLQISTTAIFVPKFSIMSHTEVYTKANTFIHLRVEPSIIISIRVLPLRLISIRRPNMEPSSIISTRLLLRDMKELDPQSSANKQLSITKFLSLTRGPRSISLKSVTL